MMYKQLSFTSALGMGRVLRDGAAEVVEAIPDDSVCPRVANPTAAVEAFQETGMHLGEQEELWVIGLDNARHVRYVEMVYRGTGNMTVINPRDIFRTAVREGCMAIFMAHNHPSGLVMPSPEDREHASTLQQAGQLLGIEVADCFVLSGQSWVSFKQQGYLQLDNLRFNLTKEVAR